MWHRIVAACTTLTPVAGVRVAVRVLARPQRWLSLGRRGGGSVALALTVWVVAGWFVVAGVVTLIGTAPAAATPIGRFVAVPGRTAQIYQPGLPAWPVPVDRLAYDEYQRGFQESDDEAIEHAFAAFEWIEVADHQAVLIIAVDGPVIQVELLTSPNIGRRCWLHTRKLAP